MITAKEAQDLVTEAANTAYAKLEENIKTLAGYKTYKKVHQKLSEESIELHKQELINAIVHMMNSDRDGYNNSIWSLVEETLQTRSVKQLKQWLE